MNHDTALPHARRRRVSLPRGALAFLFVSLLHPGVIGAAPSCATPGVGWCVAHRFAGTIKGGELGFRFGEPLDVDGDGRVDIAAGARFKLWHGNQQNGTAQVWSGKTGALVREWDGEWPDALFGHWVMPIADLSGDGLADLVIAAPHAKTDAVRGGIVVARSPKTGAEIWRHAETAKGSENLGWDMARAGDENGDGRADVFVGAPGGDDGRVLLLSGKDGTALKTLVPREPAGAFGWSVARLDDLDGDGHPEIAVGAPFAADAGAIVGAAFVLSSANGRDLWHWQGTDRRGGFGMLVAAVADLDGDGKTEIAVAAAGTEDQTRSIPGELTIYGSKTGTPLRHWSGRQPGEQYGRMIVATGDVDGDGVDDLAISAPWHRRADADRVGRIELRSGKSGAILDELFGDAADCWFGWHIVRAPDPEGRGRPTLLIGSLRHAVDGMIGAGVLDLYVLRTATHGMKTRGARRSAIK